MYTTHKIKMDLLTRQNIQTIHAVHDDTNSRYIEISLFECGVPWKVPENSQIAISYLAANGANGIYDTLPNGADAYIYGENKITIILVPSALYPGTTKVTVVISDENSNQISTFPLNVEVDENYSYGASKPETYINLRQWLSKEIRELLTYYVHVEPDGDGGYFTDSVMDDVLQACTSDAPVICRLELPMEPDNLQLPLAKHDDSTAYFSTVFEGKEYLVTISADGVTVEISECGGGNSGGNVDQSGLSTTAKNLLITILRNGIYSNDQSANITALETELASGDDGGDTVSYAIVSNLTNVTSNNSTATVAKNSAYTAILTVADGYDMEFVTVTMGGLDVTADVYTDGVVSIAAVTGNVVITAKAVSTETGGDNTPETGDELPTDGLLAYFDLRNVTPEKVGTAQGMKATQGEGALFHWGSPFLKETGDYGSKLYRGAMYSQDGSTNQTDLGTEFTVIQLSFGSVSGVGLKSSNIDPDWAMSPTYNTADGTDWVSIIRGADLNGDSVTDYNFATYRVNGNALTVIMDTSKVDFDGANYDDFVSWESKFSCGKPVGDGYGTAVAIYNRALTDIEIEEIRAFMKTLEVA